MKSAGWGAIAVALAVSVVPAEASAQDRGRADRMAQHREGGDRADAGRQRNAMEVRGQRVQQANAERARRAERPAEPRTERPSGRSQQAAQAAVRPERATRQVAQRTEPVQQAGRNRGYADQNRNRSYTPRNGNDGAREGRRTAGRNDTWQRNQGGNDRDGNGWRGNRGDSDRGGNDSWRGDRRDNDRDGNWRNGRRDNDDRAQWSGRNDNRQWNRGWRNDNRYDWNRYRNSNRVVFRVGTYYAPYRAYSYRRFGVGARIGSLFYGSSYWVNDPWRYRLPAVYGPYRWVRYYDDVLLVDIYTGQVVDVIYNFFW